MKFKIYTSSWASPPRNEREKVIVWQEHPRTTDGFDYDFNIPLWQPENAHGDEGVYFYTDFGRPNKIFFISRGEAELSIGENPVIKRNKPYRPVRWLQINPANPKSLEGSIIISESNQTIELSVKAGGQVVKGIQITSL